MKATEIVRRIDDLGRVVIAEGSRTRAPLGDNFLFEIPIHGISLDNSEQN